MANLANIRRFRVNPVEAVILLAVTGLFVRSAYNLVYDADHFKTIKAEIADSAPAGKREIASIPQSFVNLDIPCEKGGDQDTAASKVRLTGKLCGIPTDMAANKLVKTSIQNGANKFSATVFTDVTSGKFSTDYIPLNLGKNPIHIEFSYQDGKIVAQDFNIVKN